MAAWYDAENDWKRMREMENRREGEKEEKTGFPCFIHLCNFTLYLLLQNENIKNVTVYFLFIFSEKSLTPRKKLHLCKGTELVFFLLLALEKRSGE